MNSINEYTFDEIKIGSKESFQIKITKNMEDNFRNITGDLNPLHRDDGFASKVSGGRYKAHVTFGMLTASLLSTLAGVYLPGKYSLIHSVDIGFQKPVYADDIMTVEGEVRDKQDELKLLLLKVRIKNQDGDTVVKADMKVMVLK